jgi:phosphoribosylglycinamide formyltransferase-1
VKEPIKLVIFVSGKGSNARNLVSYFNKNQQVVVCGIVSSKQNPDLSAYCVENQLFYKECYPWDEERILPVLEKTGIEVVVLAGFLKKISSAFVASFPNRIINIHPSLLPKYGGAGMYGLRVHEAVFSNKEPNTGITIHLVNEHYDEGEILVQHACALHPNDTPATIESKVHQLEHQFFPKAVEQYCLSLKR